MAQENAELTQPKDIAMRSHLIDAGCKVVARPWGQLVIMPDMAVALKLFHKFVTSGNSGVWIAESGDEKNQNDKLSGAEQMIKMGKDHGVLSSPEYIEKYRKQFDYLKNPTKREKLELIVEDAIRSGDPRKVKAINDITHQLVDMIYEIQPSLRLDVRRERSEVGDVWDAGLIGAEDPRPCWDNKASQHIKRGSGGDGAYRIIINTDTSFGRSDGENSLVLCAMINVLQQYSDVEIWVQQGWVDYYHCNNPWNGITLFPAFRGAGLNPAQMMFWCGHPMRDAIFSYGVNNVIGRESGGTSDKAELECDLYTRNAAWGDMPHFNIHETDPKKREANIKVLAAWTAKQLSPMLIEESDLADLNTN